MDMFNITACIQSQLRGMTLDKDMVKIYDVAYNNTLYWYGFNGYKHMPLWYVLNIGAYGLGSTLYHIIMPYGLNIVL